MLARLREDELRLENKKQDALEDSKADNEKEADQNNSGMTNQAHNVTQTKKVSRVNN